MQEAGVGVEQAGLLGHLEWMQAKAETEREGPRPFN